MKRWIYALTAVGALAVAGCGGDSTDDGSADTATATAQATFDIDNGVSGTAEQAYENGLCEFYDASLQPGDPVVVSGADGTLLGKTQLTLNDVEPLTGFCALDFAIQGVRAGDAAYQLTVGSYPPLVLTQAELESKYYFSARSAIDVVAGETEQLAPRSS